jgi:serine/threonine protein kinase
VESHQNTVESEADKLTTKARKIGTTLRKALPDLARVDGVFLLTQPQAKIKKILSKPVRGVTFCGLSQWKDAVNFEGTTQLNAKQIASISHLLSPKSTVAVDGSLRRLAGYVHLEIQSPKNNRFHRVYKGSHPSRRDRVILHLYDLSASDESKAESIAKREFDSLHLLQLYRWAPRILDSWQEAPGYAGEMYFFTVVDPAAPTLKERLKDNVWTTANRISFAREAIKAIVELHNAGGQDNPIVHRNIGSDTILVRHDNTPIISGFDRTKIPSEVSVASNAQIVSDQAASISPEVIKLGLSAADQRSDVFSLCVSLLELFVGNDDSVSEAAREILKTGIHEDPAKRSLLGELERAFSELLGDSVPQPPTPTVRFWTEDQTIRFKGSCFRIVTRLGSGGVGTTFKVVEIEKSTGEELGSYVGKVAHESVLGNSILKAYRLARSHVARHESLSPIHEYAENWQENQFTALLGWIEGTPLSEFIGIFPLLADEQEETSAEALAIRLMRTLCEALASLHRNGLVHGDISPRNIIVSGNSMVLTDYDFVTKIGEIAFSPGTIAYCSPNREKSQPVSPSDDLYSLAASLFHVIFDREPFRIKDRLAKEQGLQPKAEDWEGYPMLLKILQKATDPNPHLRFQSAQELLDAIKINQIPSFTPSPKDTPQEITDSVTLKTEEYLLENSVTAPIEKSPKLDTATPTILSEQRVDWLKSLLQSYPGSKWGNRETRGLDTRFSAATYVPTLLENSLIDDIRSARVRLVILCGNAGDGKTALLQHIAMELGLGRHQSADRILEGTVPNGPRIRMNLDGSAAWKGRSADQLLDEFLSPFQDGPPKENIVHLLAVNDGRLLEWIEGVIERLGQSTALTRDLTDLLQKEFIEDHSHIRFITLNQRSLVGSLSDNLESIDTQFLEKLLDQFYANEKAAETWSPCRSCSAQDRCHVYHAAQIFGPKTLPSAFSEELRQQARKRLFDALQAVHLRGETHITVRELRATLVFILFGIHFCDDYHNGPVGDEPAPLPYWDRAFSSEAPARQGEVLRELVLFDPSLESHPQLDRYLVGQPKLDSKDAAPSYPDLSLISARRRAYFEWTNNDIKLALRDNVQNANSIDLARGAHIREFKALALKTPNDDVSALTHRLCAGISRLEDLPPQALERPGVVPLRITPRTPTETAFWVEKPIDRFRLEPILPPKTSGVERLHRQVSLIYKYRKGNEERLLLGAELFHLLLELADGYQLGDVSTDDAFANLSIFVQRLVREDERELLAWNPMNDEELYRISAVLPMIPECVQQKLEIKGVATENVK